MKGASRQGFRHWAANSPLACLRAFSADVAVRGIVVAALVLLMAPALHGCQDGSAALRALFSQQSPQAASSPAAPANFRLSDVPPYSGDASIEVNGNIPFFTEDDLLAAPATSFSHLDERGRCGPACMLVGPETMPTAQRGSIGSVRPSGWRIARYDWIDGKYLFNRCHLIAFALCGENDNPLNLITGTRSMNIVGMLPYEERTARYIDRTGNHVLYRTTPVFEDENLVASGVLMEAESVEDNGFGIRYCVWCYNVEPGVVIDYANGDNREGDPAAESFATKAAARQPAGAIAGAAVADDADSAPEPSGENTVPEEDAVGQNHSSSTEQNSEPATFTYVLNTNTHRFHYPDCRSVADMKEKNKQVFEGTRDEAIQMGYKPCGNCKP